MINSFKDIEETFRRGVSVNQMAKVVYQDAETKETQVIQERFPANLATAFSSILTTKRLKPYGSNVIVVTGATPEAYRQIFDGMSSCFMANRILPFPKFDMYIFYKATRVLAAAEILQIKDLQEAMQRRLNSIAGFQVSTDCLWALYTDLKCERKYKDMAVQSVAQALYEKRAKGYGHLMRFFREAPHISDDVYFSLSQLEQDN